MKPRKLWLNTQIILYSNSKNKLHLKSIANKRKLKNKQNDKNTNV